MSRDGLTPAVHPAAKRTLGIEWQRQWQLILPLTPTVDNSGTAITNPYLTAQLPAAALAPADGTTGRLLSLADCSGKVAIMPIALVAGVPTSFALQIWRLYPGRTTGPVDRVEQAWLGPFDNACRDDPIAAQVVTVAPVAERVLLSFSGAHANALASGGTSIALCEPLIFWTYGARWLLATLQAITGGTDPEVGVLAKAL